MSGKLESTGDGGWPTLLDRICPMHVMVNSAGRILHAGPTLLKICPDLSREPAMFFEYFEIRRPVLLPDVQALRAAGGELFRIRIAGTQTGWMKGDLIPLGSEPWSQASGGFLLSLSFGYSVTEAVRQYGLTASDFALTDLAIELLYLQEAKSAAMSASRNLNIRLHDDKRQAEEEARTDPLTGLRNRRAMFAIFDGLVQAQKEFALLHIDLDLFKEVNDQFGHAAGDAVLRAAAAVLLRHVKMSDVAIRTGGDEFVVIFVGMSESAVLDARATQIISALETPVLYEGHELRISASVGGALSCHYARIDPERMLDDADAALYKAKELGRGRAIIHAGGA